MTTRVLTGAMVCAWIAASPPASAQPTVVVRAESRIELRTVRGDGTVVGTLRDDLGEPLGARPIRLVARTDGGGVQFEETVTTGERGQFRSIIRIEDSVYQLTAEFAGDQTHERVVVERQVDLDRADVRLSVSVPNGGRLDLDVETHRVEVRADADVPSIEVGGADLRIELIDEANRPLAEPQTTDATGRTVFVLRSDSLGAPGAGRIKAKSVEDEHRAQAQMEVPVVRYRQSVLTLRADRTDLQPGEVLTLTGTLSDSAGPLFGRAVGTFDGDGHLATVLTDASGAYRATVDITDAHAGTHTVVARFASDAPGRASSESSPITFHVAEPRPSYGWLWLLLPMVVCAIGLAWIARRAPPPPERAAPTPPPRPAGIAVGARKTRRADRLDVAGRVADVLTGEAIAARVRAIRDDGTSHELPVEADGRFRGILDAGPYRLEARARGYASVDLSVALPHRGELSQLDIRLESLRDRALSPYRRLVVGLLPSSRLWSVWTNREVLSRGRRPPAPERIADLADRVDDACYGPEPPSEEVVAEIERMAGDLGERPGSGLD